MSELLDFRNIHNRAFITKKQLVRENITLRKQLEWAKHELERIVHGGCDTDAAIALDAITEIERLGDENE